MKEFFTLWLFLLPSFLVILLTKFIDVQLYKKRQMTDKAKKLILADLITVEAAHILTTVLALVAVTVNKMVLFVRTFYILNPILSVLSVIILYFVERKNTNRLFGTRPLKSVAFADIIISLLFNLSYFYFGSWWLSKVWDLFGGNNGTNWEAVFFIGIYAIVIFYALIKFIITSPFRKKEEDDS